MSVQSTYSENMGDALDGMIHGCDYNTKTGVVETVAGIGFGLAVAQGTADQGVILGGTTTTFLGASVRDVTCPVGDSDKYTRYKNMSYLVRGSIWCSPSHAVSAGDAVYFTAADGIFTNQSGGNVLVKGARWETTCATSGRARFSMSGLQRGVDA